MYLNTVLGYIRSTVRTETVLILSLLLSEVLVFGRVLKHETTWTDQLHYFTMAY